MSLPESDGPPVRWALLPHAPPERGEPRARTWLGAQLGTPAAALPMVRDERGRPRLLAPLADWDCNWSHSGQHLLVALGEGMQLGVDLEMRRPRPRAPLLARRYFAPDEAQWLECLPPGEREDAFIRLWCAKEAVLKANGHGLSFGLQRLCFESRDGSLALAACDPALGTPAQWQLHLGEPEPGYVAAIAWRMR